MNRSSIITNYVHRPKRVPGRARISGDHSQPLPVHADADHPAGSRMLTGARRSVVRKPCRELVGHSPLLRPDRIRALQRRGVRARAGQVGHLSTPVRLDPGGAC